MKQIRRWEKLWAALPMLILIFCVLQPILDVAGYWQDRLGISNTVTLALRMLLLAGCVLLGFLLSERKRIYVITLAVMAVFTVCHAAACIRFDTINDNGKNYLTGDAVLDLINLVRILFLPLTAICFITFLKANDRSFPAMIKGLVLVDFIIAGVQLISTVTHTDPHTYSVDGTGILGWFMWTNSQSAILGMLCPITICWSLRFWEKDRMWKRILPVLLVTAISEATLYVLAPRLAYASLIASGFGVCILVLITERKRWPQAVAVLLVTALFICLYPFSPTHRRLDDNQVRAEKTSERIKEMDIVIETRKPADSEGGQKTPEEPKVVLSETDADKMEKLYRSQGITWNIIERFGRERVFRANHYTLNPYVLSSTRNMKIIYCRLLMEDGGVLSRIFGLNLQEMYKTRVGPDGVTVLTDIYDVENDFHGVYFLTGIVGLGLMILFLLYFLLRAAGYLLIGDRGVKMNPVSRLWKTFRSRLNLQLTAFLIAYGIGLIHAYFTASVLRRTNASVYLAMVLAGLWYLTRKKAPADPAPALPETEE